MQEEVLAFERKLTVLARDLQRGTLSHFPSLREFKQDQTRADQFRVFAVCNHHNASVV